MSRAGHVPIRMCVGCRTRRKKMELVRFVRVRGEGERVVPHGKHLEGRGFYLCPDGSCWKRAMKKYPHASFLDMDSVKAPFWKRSDGGQSE